MIEDILQNRHINSKQEFYALSKKLLLGNRLRQWTFQEFEDMMIANPDSLPEVVGIRHVRAAFTNKGISGLMTRRDALSYGYRTLDFGNILIDEGAVHNHLTIQGELMPDVRHLYLRYSFLKCHQRTLWMLDEKGLNGVWQLKVEQVPHNCEILGHDPGTVVKHAFGLEASSILKKYMDHDSYDTVSEILERYSHNSSGPLPLTECYPIIEFACFDRPIGILDLNTLVWEVRTRY